MRRWKRYLTGVRLEGEPRDTKLIVDFYDGNEGRDLSIDFDLWGKDFEAGFEGKRDSSQGVLQVITIHVTDPAFPLRDY